METQLDNIQNKAHVLETLGYSISDALLAVIIINCLSESYEVLKTILTQEEDTKLVTETIFERILTKEKVKTAASQTTAFLA